MDQHIKDVFKSYLDKNRDIKRGFYEQKIIAIWERRLGSTISSRTQKIQFKSGTLTAYVDSAALRQELLQLQSNIIEIMNQELGTDIVQKIIIR